MMNEAELRPDQVDETTKKDDHRRQSIATFSGIEFFPFEARPEDVNLMDIANAISNKCRYTGQCTQFYSVAQHAMFVSKILRHRGEGPVAQLQGLHHDDPEAYGPDIASPVKGMVFVKIGEEFVPYRDHEEKLMGVICEAEGIPFPFPKVIKVADAEAFKHEYRQIMPDLTWWEGGEPEGKYPDISFMDCDLAREMFLRMHRQLVQECVQLDAKGSWTP